MPNQPSPTLYIIDASSYVYRAFHALPPLTSSSGEPVNAVLGFTTMILKLLKMVQPTALIAVFDQPQRTFRDDLYPAYKANREAMPSELVSQMDGVHSMVKAFQIRSVSVAGVEADDVIATLARQVTPRLDVVVITGDKDLAQIVDDHVRLWDTMRDRWFDPAAVRERFGVAPAQIADLMALMGDAIDNVPGVPGIGAKTAAALLQEFGSLETILQSLEQVAAMKGLRGATKVAAALREHASLALLSQNLTRLKGDVPLSADATAFEYGGPDLEALRLQFEHHGFQRLLKEFATSTLPNPVEAAARWGPGEIDQILDAAAKSSAVGFACETVADEVVLGLATSDGLRGCFRGSREDVDRLLPLFADSAIAKITYDLKSNLLRLGGSFDDMASLSDVMIASYLLEASTTHRLEDLSAQILGEALLSESEPLEDRLTGIASISMRLATRLDQQIRDQDMEGLYRDVEIPLARVLARMEREGIFLDTAILEAMSVELNVRAQKLESEIYELAGGPFNISSPPQLRELLFGKLALPTKGVKRGKTGLSTDVDVLTRLSLVHPLPKRILDYRSVTKLKSTYVDALPAAVDPITHRLHSSFNQTIAATGRLSSSNPNLQNIPIRGEDGRRIRSAFVAPLGHHLLVADYSQIELRVLAHLTEDEGLREAFRKNADIHAETASTVFGVLPGLVSPEMRRVAKVINFGVIYGMGAVSLAKEIGSSTGEAERYIHDYFERHVRVRDYIERVRAQARATGYVSTILGRRRAVPNIASADRNLQQLAERIATNTPIQGSAADLIKVAMVHLDAELKRTGYAARLVLQVHDELVFEVEDGCLAEVTELVRTGMEGAYPLLVPLVVSIGVGKNWSQAH